MKKVLAVALVAIMVLGLCACTVNKNEVSVLWSGDQDTATVPNSLINAMDRALYIEKISYKHYAANGDQSKQTSQAQAALDAGCAALMVELVDVAAAQDIVELAKAKNVPVVFFGCDVDEAVVSSYEKCALVTTDVQTQGAAYSQMVYDYVGPSLQKQTDAKNKGKEKDGIDKDGDGKVTYLALGEISLTQPVIPEGKKQKYDANIEFVPVTGKIEDLTVQTVEKKKLFGTEEHGRLVTADGKIVEMILSDNDEQMLEALVQLQALDFNTNKLVTHFVPVFTVGEAADYKAYVMPDMPADEDARKVYLEEIRYLVDMSALSNKDWKAWVNAEEDNAVDSMVYTTRNQIGAGRISGTAVEDYDSLAETAALIVASLLKGKTLNSNIVGVSYAYVVAG